MCYMGGKGSRDWPAGNRPELCSDLVGVGNKVPLTGCSDPIFSGLNWRACKDLRSRVDLAPGFLEGADEKLP
jgi:hypothetical protein